MLILLDQCTPIAIREALKDHTVKTAHEQGWSAILNGDLLRVAEGAGFDVLVTTDTSLPYQRNLIERRLGIVIRQIVTAVEMAKPGTCILVDIPACAKKR